MCSCVFVGNFGPISLHFYLVSTPGFVPRTYRKFRFFNPQRVFFLYQVIQEFMRPVGVVSPQPALCNFPSLFEGSE